MKLHIFARVAASAAALLLSAFIVDGHNYRLLYWNIQNGMWAGQDDNYDSFVNWVKEKNPDICVWCEAQTIYKNGTNERLANDQKYLVKHWPELALRYGHKYVYFGGQRDNYPQVVTSKYPIESVEKILGAKPDSVVSHGAGWARVQIEDKSINVVCLHTWPQAFYYGTADQAKSVAEHGGDKYRRMEIEYICKHTIGTDPSASKNLWMMMGDFNSVNRSDNSYYGYPSDDSRFWVQDYVSEHTPYMDVIKNRYPDRFTGSTVQYNRIDYVYFTKALYDRVFQASTILDSYTTPTLDPVTDFCHPSDHLPIIVDFKL
jgi:endonuclease/exonuclease/phosphatase family metal-dependent hydrolase